MRRELFRRPGVGCRSSQKRSIQVARLAAMKLPHDRDGCGSNAEQVRVGIVDVHTHWKPRGEMYPVECALDIWQAASDFSVFRENAIADPLYMAFEPAVRMCHQLAIAGAADIT